MNQFSVATPPTGLHGRPGEFFVQSMSVANHAEATPPARVADEMIRTRRRFHVRGGWRHAERGEDAWRVQRLAGTRNAVVQQSAPSQLSPGLAQLALEPKHVIHL